MPERSGRKAILLVDDDEDVRGSLERLVQRMIPQVECLGAASAEEALGLLTRRRVHAIVSDFRMPNMNGVDFLEQAKRLSPGVVTLMLTAFPTAKIAREAVQRGGVVLLITKPFDPQAFAQVLKSILQER